MMLLRKAARDISIVSASQLVMWLATFAFTIALARYLGPERFGQLSLALSYTAFFTIFVDFGLGKQLSRLVAQRSGRLREAVAATIVLRTALWLLTIPVAWLITVVLGYELELQETVLVLTVSVLFVNLASAIGAYLQGREEFLVPSLAAAAHRLAAAVIGIYLLALGQGILAMAWAYVVASVLNVAVVLFPVRAAMSLRPQIDARAMLVSLRNAAPLALYGVGAAFYVNVGMVLLERMVPPENVGWYAAATRLFFVATMVPTIVAGTVLYPVLSRLSVGSRAELRAVIEKAVTFLTVTGVAGALLLAVFAEPIVAFLYPTESYGAAANVLRLLAPGLVMMYLNTVFASALIGLHQEWQLLVMAIAAAVLNPIANFVAIMFFQQDGAAVVNSLTELLLLVWLARAMPRDLLSFENLRVGLKAAVAAIAAALAVAAVQHQPLVVTLPLALIVYGVTALALRVVAPQDFVALQRLFVAAGPTGLETVAEPIREEVA